MRSNRAGNIGFFDLHYCFLTIANIDNAGYLRAVHLGNALIRRGATVSYVLEETAVNRRFDRFDQRARIEFVGPPRSPSQFQRRRRALRDLAPDYVEVLSPHPKTLIPLIGLERTKVVALWDEPAFLKDLPPFRLNYERLMARWMARRADLHIAATKRLREELRAGFGIDALYMPHAAYLPKYPDGESPYERPTAAFMGNFYPDWDHDIIFQAALMLAGEGKRPPIAFMGTGPDEARWREFARQHSLDNLTFLGFTTGPDLWRRLRHAHILLFPIRSTPGNWLRCPSKTFAYGQARRPVVTSRVGEVAQVLGETATFVDSTPEAFARAIDRLMGEKDLADVDYQIERHNWDDRAGSLLQFLGR